MVESKYNPSASVKYGLIGAVSVGFGALAYGLELKRVQNCFCKYGLVSIGVFISHPW